MNTYSWSKSIENIPFQIRHKVEIYECINCNKSFVRMRVRRSTCYSGVRKTSAITCSKECSREYHYNIRKGGSL